MRPRPQRAPLPTMPSLAELKAPVALHASATSSSVTNCTSYASTSHHAIPVRAFCTSGSTGIDTPGLPDRASVSALETQREEQYLVDQAFDLFIEHHNLVAKTYDQHTTTCEDYYSSYMEIMARRFHHWDRRHRCLQCCHRCRCCHRWMNSCHPPHVLRGLGDQLHWMLILVVVLLMLHTAQSPLVLVVLPCLIGRLRDKTRRAYTWRMISEPPFLSVWYLHHPPCDCVGS